MNGAVAIILSSLTFLPLGCRGFTVPFAVPAVNKGTDVEALKQIEQLAGTRAPQLLHDSCTRNARIQRGQRRTRMIPTAREPDEQFVGNISHSSGNNLGRAFEISSTLLRDVVIPLCASVLRRPWAGQESSSLTWDTFWSSKSSSNYTTALPSSSSSSSPSSSPTNAERLARALELLGPTWVKFGQAVASRPDIFPVPLASALSTLQDRMIPFDTSQAKATIKSELGSCGVDDSITQSLLDSLSDEPVAAASIGQVYKGHLVGYGDVAVKVKRPGVEEMVRSDATLLRAVAEFVESIPALPPMKDSSYEDSQRGGKERQRRMVKTEVVNGVDEFMTRMFEELDYTREAQNAQRFADLYAIGEGSERKKLPNGSNGGVIVPKFMSDMCTKNVLIMEWIDGSKLVSDLPVEGHANSSMSEEESKVNLAMVELGIQCTLSQLLDTGTLHADPHGGNLIKVKLAGDGQYSLAYLDFGIVAQIPEQVRDGLVCAVAQLIFARDVEAVVELFGELALLPDDILSDQVEMAAFAVALEAVTDEALVYPEDADVIETTDALSDVPDLRFDKILDGLSRLVPRFQFQLPPYFLNNARALGTLEGMARSLNPDFNLMQFVYPYALNRLLRNPSGSPVVGRTLQSLISDPSGCVDRRKLSKLIRDASIITGFSRRKVLRDVLTTKAGQRFVLHVTGDEIRGRLKSIRRPFRLRTSMRRKKRERLFSDYLKL